MIKVRIIQFMLIMVFPLLFILAIACAPSTNPVTDTLKQDATAGRGEETWFIVESPLTEKCYEVYIAFRVLGMSEVDCDIETTRR